MTVLHRCLGALLATVLMAALVWASNAPIAVQRSHDALLRLAWSARPERVENCRQASADQLARLPPHMRQPVACEGATAQYRLQVRVDGALVADRVVHGGGLRRDRRLYVLEELSLPPGEAAVAIRFDRIDASPAASDATDVRRPGAAPAAPRGEFVPPHLSFEQHLVFSPRTVILITYAPEHRTLVSRQQIR